MTASSLQVLPLAEAIAALLSAESAAKSAAVAKGTARIEAMLATAKDGETDGATVARIAGECGKSWTAGTANARASEFNTGARLAEALEDGAKAVALIQELWTKSAGDKAAATIKAVREATKAARSGKNLVQVRAAGVKAIKAEAVARAARQTAPKAKDEPKADPTAPEARMVDLRTPEGQTMALAAMLVDVKAVSIPVKAEKAREDAVRALETAQVAVATFYALAR